MLTPATSHDAGYARAVVYDKVNHRIVDYCSFTRTEVDKEFLEDLRTVCRRRIPVTAKVALGKCLWWVGWGSFGAHSR